jgi:hypothetical protein
MIDHFYADEYYQIKEQYVIKIHSRMNRKEKQK